MLMVDHISAEIDLKSGSDRAYYMIMREIRGKKGVKKGLTGRFWG